MGFTGGGGDGKAGGSLEVRLATEAGGLWDFVRKFVLNSHFLSLCGELARLHTH